MVLSSPNWRTLRILVVDDYADNAESMAMLLRLDGNQVFVALDGPTALEMAEIARPDVVLCDISMPNMTGYEVARQLRMWFGNRPLLAAITAYSSNEARGQSLAAGFDYHFVKPVDPVEVRELLREFARNSKGLLLARGF